MTHLHGLGIKVYNQYVQVPDASGDRTNIVCIIKISSGKLTEQGRAQGWGDQLLSLKVDKQIRGCSGRETNK